MAYDHKLADRIRATIGEQPELTEREMFGGIGFMLQGNMAVGVIGEELLVRVEKSQTDELLEEPGTRVFDFSGRPMKGWVMVNSEGFTGDQDFQDWLQRGVNYALSLPAK